MSRSETELQKEIREALNATGLCKVWRNQSGKVKVRGGWMQLGPEGSPDLVGYIRNGGVFLGVEVKRPGEEPSTEQHAFHRDILNEGGIVIVCGSAEEAVLVLRAECVIGLYRRSR